MKKSLATLLILLISTCVFAQHKYYVDGVNGNDANTSTQAQNQATPWKTIAKINSFFTSLVAGDSVLFRRGQTFTGTLTGAGNKSGTNVAKINFGAYGTGTNPIFSGFFSIPSWTSIGGNKWTAVVPSAQTTLNMLTINGAFQPIGRFPKVNSATTSWPSGGYLQFQSVGGSNPPVAGQASSLTSNQIAAALNYVGGEVVYRANHFNINRGIITAQTSTTVTFTQENPGNGFTAFNTTLVNFGFFFQNHPNACTAQGDWAYTPSTKTVTLFSTTTPTGVAVSVQQNNVILSGNNFLSFSNISFQGANQAGILIQSSNNIVFVNCDVSLQGTNGIQCTNNSATHDLTFTNSTMSAVMNNGIDCNSTTAWNINNSVFTNNSYVAGMGVSSDGQQQVISYLGNNSSVTNNTLNGCGFNGIMFRGNNVTVKNNFVNNTCTIKDDAGGIYSFKTTAANTISGNIVINSIGAPNGTADGIGGGAAYGIYCDGFSTGNIIQNNSIAAVEEDGILLNAPVNATVTGNTVYNCGTTTGVGGQIQINENAGQQNVRGIINTKNIYVANNTGQQGMLLYAITQNDVNLFFQGGRTDSNIIARPVAQNVVVIRRESTIFNYTLPQWQTFIAPNETHSKGTPKAIPDTTINNIIFRYNATNGAVSVPLIGTWMDMNGVNYTGSISLPTWSSTVLLFVSAPPTLTGTATPLVNPLTCFGQTTSMTINATGGVPPYQYNLGSGSYSATNVFPNLAAGTYQFHVKDNAGTIVAVNGTITQPTQITITESNPPITINGQLISITINASGGNAGTYTYSLDGINFQTSNVFTNKGAGTYTATVKDSKGCTNTLTFTITQPSLLTLSLSITSTLPCSNSTTTLVSTAVGGTTPYSYQLNNGSSQSSPNFIVGAGSWQVTVTDAAGAIATQTLPVSAPTAILLSESHTTITINGGISTVTLSSSGGTGSKLFAIDSTPFQSGNSFLASAGNHTAFARDANNCLASLPFTITQPTALLVSASITGNILCNGASTGQITGNAAGGTTPYDYQLNGGTRQSSPIFSGLSAGTYTLTVHDAGGAIASASPITITQPAIISVAVSFGFAPATVTVNASGGVGVLNYSLDGGAFQPSNVFTGVSAGTHNVVVRDFNGCLSAPKTFTVLAPLQISVSATTITCNNGSSVVTVSASGGQPPYTGIGTFSKTAGTYTFTVTDAINSVSQQTITIPQPTAIIFTLSYGAAPATVTVAATGGAGGYNYSLDGGAYQPSNIFTGVSAGNHTMIVKDANGCLSNQQTFTVGSALQISVGATPILCNNGSSTVTVGATGGTPPYTGTGTFSRTAGTYTFSVTDNAGAVSQQTITITQPAAIIIGLVFDVAPTTVTVNASGGVAPLTYKLDGSSPQSSNVFTNVGAGSHTITVTDNNSCTNSQSFTVVAPLSISLSAGTISCNGGITSATVIASNGIPPYRYSWSNGQVQATANNLTAGTYTVTVTDNANHVHDTTFTLLQPPQINIGLVIGTITVNGGSAPVTVNASGGSGSGYTYSLDSAAYVSTNNFTVTAGNHFVIVKDGNGCTQRRDFSLSQPGKLIITISRGAAILCAGGAQAITVGSTGGTAPINGTGTFSKLAGTYTFSVTDAFNNRADTIINVVQPPAIVVSATFTPITVNGGTSTVTGSAGGGTGTLHYSLDGSPTQLTGVFTGVTAGPHTLTVTDANNCSQIYNFSISQPSSLTMTATPVTNPFQCYGDVTNVSLAGFGGTTPYTYGINGTFGSSNLFSNLSAGTYKFSVKDAFGVQHDTIITLSQPPLITLTQITQSTILAYGGTADSVIVTNAGGTPISGSFYQYSLDGGSFVQSDSAFKYVYYNMLGGSHYVTIKDANGCTQRFDFTITQPPAPVPYQQHGRKQKQILIQL